MSLKSMLPPPTPIPSPPTHRHRGLVLVSTITALFVLHHTSLAEPAADAVVWHASGQARGHVEDCPRFKRLSEAEKAKMDRITPAELEKRDAMLCSRCPGSNTPGKGNPQLLPPERRPEPLPDSWVKPAPAETTQFEFVPSPLAPLIFMGADGKLDYRPFSEKGDKLMDWSYCGYKNSSVPIPMVPVAVTFDPRPGEAVKVGNMAYPQGQDSRSEIQAAIDRVAKMKADADGIRGAVLLKRGTWYITGPLTIRSGVVLRGEGDGEDGTVLIMTSEKGGDTAIRLGDPEAEIETVGADNAVRITNRYLPSGSIRLEVEDASRFKVGNFIHVRKTTNQAWIDALGMGERLRHIRGGREGLNKRPWVPEAYRPAHLRRITAIDGRTLTLDGVLPESIDEIHGGGIVYLANVDALGTHAGVESLRIVSNYDTTVRDSGKDASFLNFKNGITVGGTSDSWVRDCTVLHVSFAAVGTQRNSRQITVRDTKCLAPVGPKRGGFRYAFNIAGGTLHLFYNCHSEDGRHDFSLGSRQTGPFAFVECTAVRGQQSEPHHRWSTGALYDNVVTRDGTLAAINRGDSGSGHGWSAANTMFWNCDARSIVVMNPETAGENNFAIGYTGTYDPKTGPTALRYANDRAGYWGTPQEGKYFGFALMGSGHIESPDKPVEPGSLFKQQLIDRIGTERAAAVMKPAFSCTPDKLEPEATPAILFEDSLTGDWRENWFLDGEKVTLEASGKGLHVRPGPVTKAQDPVEYHAHHGVLWTQQEFEGDIGIRFEYTRMSEGLTTLLYIQAQGTGPAPYVEDIHAWRALRNIPAMEMYFKHMNLTSLSFREEIRARRYPWQDESRGIKYEETLMEPMLDYDKFPIGVAYQIDVENRADTLRIRVEEIGNPENVVEQSWNKTKDIDPRRPPLSQKGRIGLRNMGGVNTIYRNFQVRRL